MLNDLNYSFDMDQHRLSLKQLLSSAQSFYGGENLVDPENIFLAPWSIGSYDENEGLFETLLLELIRDHISWCQNYHAENTTSGSGAKKTSNPEFIRAVADMKQQINRLTSELKKSVVMNSPQYFGCMNSDLLLPGLIAQLLTTLYNPNKVTGGVAPVTVNMELEAGRQIARMLGYNTEPTIYPCAWGHITSGSNTANYDSLWNARAVSCYPLALKAVAKKLQFELKINVSSNKKITECTSWECQNFSVDDVLALHQFVYQQLLNKTDPQTVNKFFKQVSLQRVEHLGMASFFAEHWDAKQPLLLVPATAGSSWRKALKLLGFGSNQLIEVDVNSRMRIDIDSLERVLINAEQKKIPIMAVVGILGSTEFGSIDPINEIIRLRDQFKNKGLNFYFHVDASWGGYLSSLFRNEDDSMVSLAEIQKCYKYFPNHGIYDAFAAVKYADSVTVDPHKMGYLPFETGAFISRNRDITNLTKNGSFVVHDRSKNNADHKIQQLRQYLLEGTKPGAAAVACCLTQRILPLNNKHFGRMLGESIHASEYFYDRIKLTMKRLESQAIIVLPMEPDCNIFCLAINPVNNHCLSRMNRFSQRVYKQLQISPEQSTENRAFFCSIASLLHSNLGNEDAHQLLNKLGIKESTFVKNIDDPRTQTNAIIVLRHTLLNPKLLTRMDDNNYIDRYCVYLEQIIRETVAKESSNTLIAVGTS